jgi:Protein of unknown function (DUF3054)
MPAPASRSAAPSAAGARSAVGDVVAALLADVACVVGFAAIGRASHDESDGLAALWSTAWPFLVGVGLGWLASRAWRSPMAMMPTGIAVWLSTVVAGMLIRGFTGAGTAPSFVVVATVVLALFIVGWRLLVAVRRRVLRS